MPQIYSDGEYSDLVQCIFDRGGNNMNQAEPKESLRHRIYNSLKPDWAFGFVLLVGLGLLVLEVQDPQEQVMAAWSATTIAGAAIMFTVIIAFLATILAALDRKKTDDYHFQIMANSAIIAIITAIFVNMVWSLAEPQLGTMSVQILIAILLFAWGLGYFFYRWRGFGQ
ncbi:MAG: hypothetical protein AAGE37_00580 [Pseudomonadota bacterium]